MQYIPFSVNYTCIGLDIHLERNIGYYLTQTYVPCVLVVILSWVNFWLSIDAVPARISLGLLTVLTMTTQSSAAVRGLTVVSYVKAMDVWIDPVLLSQPPPPSRLEFTCQVPPQDSWGHRVRNSQYDIH